MRILYLFLFHSALSALAQSPPPDQRMPPRPSWDSHRPPGPPGGMGPHGGPPSRWWRDPGLAQRIQLSSEQQKRMDDVYEQSRGTLNDLRASVQKEQVALEPLLGADRVDETATAAQIDRVAAARAELEKATARMLLRLRLVISQEQWRRLQSDGMRQPPPGGPPR